MRSEVRAAIFSLPMLCITEQSAGTEGIPERILDITEKMTQETTTTLGKAGKIAAPVTMAIDAHTIVTERQRLSKFSELKKTRIPTQTEINEAAKSTEILGALGGAEWVNPVREVATGASSRTAGSAQLIQAVISRNGAAITDAGQRIDATTLSIAQRRAMPDNSLEMLQQSTPGLAGDSWTIRKFVYDTLSPAFEKYLDWRENHLNHPGPDAGSTAVVDIEPQAGPAIVSDKWKITAISSTIPGGIPTEGLDTCEAYPGFGSDNWGEVFVKQYFANPETGKRCVVTFRDDGDPVHKRYEASCEYTTQNTCTEIYCSPDASGRPISSSQDTKTREMLDVTREYQRVITQVHEMASSWGSVQTRTVFERCTQ